MSCEECVKTDPSEVPLGTAFLDEICLPFLLSRQNADGGWGFQEGLESRVEPTAWALLALAQAPVSSSRAARQAAQWLLRAQLSDGSWPATNAQATGCAVTALACLALRGQAGTAEAAARGVRWIGKAWPAEGGLGWRLGRWLFHRSRPVHQNSRLRGWSWTPGTASWVEPTAYSLLLLQAIPEELRTGATEKRRRLGEAMLYDRMCPGGGWNSGNPLVYGVAGIPRVVPTAWALLALRKSTERPENQQSLDWLERKYSVIEGPGSLALAHFCLRACGRPTPALAPGLQKLFARDGFLGSIVVMSWAVMALSAVPHWLVFENRKSEIEVKSVFPFSLFEFPKGRS